MELRHLRYFCAVAETGHVTRAAERLRVAQPALTQQIKALEAELGTPLLRRVGRNIELTDAGRAFWKEGQAALDQVRVAVVAAQQVASGQTGRVAIGLTETASFAPPVTAVLKQARACWPQVEFSLMQARSNDLVPALVERRVDVSFMRSPAPDEAALRWQPFLTEEMVVALPAAHTLAQERAIDLPRLAAEQLIFPRGRLGDIGLRRQIDARIRAGRGHVAPRGPGDARVHHGHQPGRRRARRGAGASPSCPACATDAVVYRRLCGTKPRSAHRRHRRQPH